MASKVGTAVAENPATTVSSIGIAIAAFGALVGWDADTVNAVTTIALVLTPVISQAVKWWQRNHS